MTYRSICLVLAPRTHWFSTVLHLSRISTKPRTWFVLILFYRFIHFRFYKSNMVPQLIVLPSSCVFLPLNPNGSMLDNLHEIHRASWDSSYWWHITCSMNCRSHCLQDRSCISEHASQELNKVYWLLLYLKELSFNRLRLSHITSSVLPKNEFLWIYRISANLCINGP
jgi:hypothetical protein